MKLLFFVLCVGLLPALSIAFVIVFLAVCGAAWSFFYIANLLHSHADGEIECLQ